MGLCRDKNYGHKVCQFQKRDVKAFSNLFGNNEYDSCFRRDNGKSIYGMKSESK